MDEQDSSTRKKKRKRGRSLIFKTCFLLPGSGSGDDHESKVLASDDNLVYCDLTNTGTNGNSNVKTTRSSSSRGRMSSIFKAVLFDTAMKKKIRGKRASKTTVESTNSSLVSDEKPDHKSFDENISNVVKVSEAGDDSSNNGSHIVSLPPEIDASPMALSSVYTDSQMSTERKVTDDETNSSLVPEAKTDNSFDKNISNVVKVLETGNDSSTNVVLLPPKIDASSVTSTSVNINSQMLTERKIMSRINSTNKKLLSSGSPSRVKPIPEKSSKPTTLNHSTSRLCLFFVLVVFVSVVLWMSFKTTVTESANLDSDPNPNIAMVGDEL